MGVRVLIFREILVWVDASGRAFIILITLKRI